MTDFLTVATLDERLRAYEVLASGGNVLPPVCYESGQLDLQSSSSMDTISDPLRVQDDIAQCPLNNNAQQSPLLTFTGSRL